MQVSLSVKDKQVGSDRNSAMRCACKDFLVAGTLARITHIIAQISIIVNIEVEIFQWQDSVALCCSFAVQPTRLLRGGDVTDNKHSVVINRGYISL
jgi:hypothetical protein